MPLLPSSRSDSEACSLPEPASISTRQRRLQSTSRWPCRRSATPDPAAPATTAVAVCHRSGDACSRLACRVGDQLLELGWREARLAWRRREGVRAGIETCKAAGATAERFGRQRSYLGLWPLATRIGISAIEAHYLILVVTLAARRGKRQSRERPCGSSEAGEPARQTMQPRHAIEAAAQSLARGHKRWRRGFRGYRPSNRSRRAGRRSR